MWGEKDEMARKRKALQNLNYNSKEYWNRLLVEEGLSVDAGRSQRIAYVGGATDIEMLEIIRRTDTGRTPIPEPDDEENF